MKSFYTCHTYAILAGFVLDFILGDPHSLPHPVKLIGNLISFLESKLRHGKNDVRDIYAGTVTTMTTVVTSTAVPLLILLLLALYLPYAYFFISAIMCWQMLSARQLMREAKEVEKNLELGLTEEARRAVSMIVGRDTEKLDEQGITRAAVETVAENTSDGVIAPLFWMLLFGPVGGFFYKSVNTLDSMIGYKNDKYIYFGRTAAKLDDFVNFIPSRLTAVLMIAAAPFLKMNTKNAATIWKRDRRKHDSPNSAQSESVCAGALEIRLAGPATYGGVLHEKEYIGDPINEIEPHDISRACSLMYLSSAFMLIFTILLRSAVALCF